MQDRRGFMRALFGAAVGIATGGLGKVAEAITTKPAAAKILHGFRGGSFLDAGYCYAPYIPLYATPVIDPEHFKASKEIMKKYKEFKPFDEHYSVVLLKNL
jgi:hypothetical protein